MSRYGQGNGPSWAKRMRANRRSREAVSVIDERDMGVRMVAVERLGLDGDRRATVTGSCGCEFPSASRLFRHMASLRFKRDAGNNLPFGVY